MNRGDGFFLTFFKQKIFSNTISNLVLLTCGVFLSSKNNFQESEVHTYVFFHKGDRLDEKLNSPMIDNVEWGLLVINWTDTNETLLAEPLHHIVSINALLCRISSTSFCSLLWDESSDMERVWNKRRFRTGFSPEQNEFALHRNIRVKNYKTGPTVKINIPLRKTGRRGIALLMFFYCEWWNFHEV